MNIEENNGYRSSVPLSVNQLKQYLNFFSKDDLVAIIWTVAQTNVFLWQALNARIGLQENDGDWEKIVEIIDFVFSFPSFVPYTEHGYHIIIDEIIKALEILYYKTNQQFALRVAHYVYERGQTSLECFDEGWEWECALEELDEWINAKKAV